MPKLACTQGNVRSQPIAFAFAASCPALEYFAWEADASDLSVVSLRDFMRGGGNLYLPRESAQVADDAEPGCPGDEARPAAPSR